MMITQPITKSTRWNQYVAAISATLLKVGWLPISVFVAHEICAHVIPGYEKWPAVDIPLHLLGGFAIAVFTYGAITIFVERKLLTPPDALLMLLLVFTVACSSAVFWEFLEWTADNVFGHQSQLGLDDTILDLFMGVVGAIAFTMYLAFRLLRRFSQFAATNDH